LAKIIITLTIPAYTIIAKNEKPIRTGNLISFKIIANTTKEAGTPKIYQYNNNLVFLDFSLYIFFSSPKNIICLVLYKTNPTRLGGEDYKKCYSMLNKRKELIIGLKLL
jgi:hypothetical protein